MLCALSGEVPEEPVVSKKTGIIYEKRLILKYLEENQNKGPGDEEELDPEDLLPLKSSHVVRPRPPNLTSLPSMLKSFQDEWDALVLELFNTRQELGKMREELATALYQQDAAVRVIARLTKERDEARKSLSRVTISSGEALNGDAMVVDSQSLPEELVAHVDETQKKLSKTRKKRPIPEDWASVESVANLTSKVHHIPYPVIMTTCLALNSEEKKLAVAGYQGTAVTQSLDDDIVKQINAREPITAAVWWGDRAVFATAKGSIKSYQGCSENQRREHAGAVTGLALHPGGRILASVGVDKAILFYDDSVCPNPVLRVTSDESLTTCQFHPDGHLFAAGTQTGNIKIFDTKTGSQMTAFTLGAPVQALAFSENGYWLAVAGKGTGGNVVIYDLRKEGDAARARELTTQAGQVEALAWDYSAQFLATTGAGGVTVQYYNKASKSWSEIASSAEAGGVGIAWGPLAKSLYRVNGEGVVAKMGA